MRNRNRRLGTWVACGLLLASSAWLVGCDPGSPSPPGPQGSYTGTFADSAGASGTVEFELPSAAPQGMTAVLPAAAITISGEVKTPAGSVPLSGSYDPDTGELFLSGTGYTFTGELQSNGQFQGSCTTPGGTGIFVTIAGNSSEVQTFCGTFSQCNDPFCTSTTQLGTLNAAVNGSVAVAAIYTPADGGAVIVGTASGTTVDFDIAFGAGQIHAGGQIVGGTLSGDWATVPPSAATGVWSADAAACH